MRGVLCGCGLGVLVGLAGIGPASAAIPPPPPGAPPPCCTSPPPAPTQVPTLPATVVPQGQLVSVRLAPTHVRRGQKTTLAVKAPSRDDIQADVRFRDGKSLKLQGKVGKSGTFSRVWRIPKHAALGGAAISITIRDGKKIAYHSKVSFVVTK